MKSLLANLKSFTLPFNAFGGKRIVLEGSTASESFYDENGALVGLLSPDIWYMGSRPGERVQIDPLGGLRIINSDDDLVAVLDKGGLQLRVPETGELLATLTTQGLTILDAADGQDIVLQTSQAGATPLPRYAGRAESNPGDHLVTPLSVAYATNDLVLRHVAAFAGSEIGAQTMTAPGGSTEVLDVNLSSDSNTLGVSVATRSPASTGVDRTFVSTSAAWPTMAGTTVVVRGDPAGPTPSIRSASVGGFLSTVATLAALPIAAPPTIVAGDLLVAFVTMGNDGGSVPISWTTPEGWFFQGAIFVLIGSGTSQRCCAVGVWAKVATADDVALGAGSGVYDVTVTTQGGQKKFHHWIACVKDVEQLGGGADITIGGRSVGRGGVANTVDAASSAAVTAETAVLTSTPFACLPSRAYRATYSARISGTSGTDGLFRLRQDDAAGASIADGGRIRMNSAGITQGSSEDGIFTVTDAGVIVVCLTLENVAGGANTVQHRAPRRLTVEDIGSSAAYPNAVLLTP